MQTLDDTPPAYYETPEAFHHKLASEDLYVAAEALTEQYLPLSDKAPSREACAWLHAKGIFAYGMDPAQQDKGVVAVKNQGRLVEFWPKLRRRHGLFGRLSQHDNQRIHSEGMDRCIQCVLPFIGLQQLSRLASGPRPGDANYHPPSAPTYPPLSDAKSGSLSTNEPPSYDDVPQHTNPQFPPPPPPQSPRQYYPPPPMALSPMQHPGTGVHYFEITIPHRSFDFEYPVVIGIGLTTRPYPLFRQPGWNKYSIGWHSDDGRVYINDPGDGMAFGPVWGVDSQRAQTVVGCGIVLGQDIEEGAERIFFTLNGQWVGSLPLYTFFPSGLPKFWFPTVGADGPVDVQVNFGTEGFAWHFHSAEGESFRPLFSGHVTH
ncbi:hypothetical protein BZG36_01986 [Bifiguratus adelaidae]|uniref:B30.2/SPRY domain-containing protein n=1 Tax=Bifiguratus adelaidae TaxID=1938954 RepID=A0A261Y449_9FUNG|nr:hypothetical protein BZG36_01986 [Bifiguratus adelaidae]